MARKIFSGPEKSKNGHFVNGKTAVSPVARKRFPKLRNVQKWTVRELEHGRFSGGEETFNRYRNVGKNFHFVNGMPAVSPVARKSFLKLLYSQKWSLRNGKPAVLPVARNIF